MSGEETRAIGEYSQGEGPSRRTLLAAAAAIGALIAWLVLGTATGPRLDYVIGDRVTQEIVAPVQLSVPDPQLTEARRSEAADLVPPVFDIRRGALADSIDRFSVALTRLGADFNGSERGRFASSPDAFAAAHQAELPFGGKPVIAIFARQRFNPSLIASVKRALETQSSKLVLADDVPAVPNLTAYDTATGTSYPVLFRDVTRLSEAKEGLRREILSLDGIPPADRRVLADELNPLVSVTLTPNSSLTNAAREQARASVGDVSDEYTPGEVIGYRNQTVDLRMSRALDAINKTRRTPNLLARGSGVVILAWSLLFGLWLAASHDPKRVPGPRRSFLLSSLLLLLQVGFIRLGFEVSTRLGSFAHAGLHAEPMYVLATPLVVAPLATALLGGGVLGLVEALTLVPLVVLMTSALPSGGLPVGVFVVVLSLVAVRAASTYHARLVVASAAIALALGSVVAVAAALLVSGTSSVSMGVVGVDVGLASLGAVFSAALTAILLPAAELAFGIVSDVRLLELANADRPLLRELAIRAPGTHQHSYVMSSIATEAAKAIGANVLLVRIGAYYHDIGKLHAPEMFVENQSGGPNPHDELDPVESARQIIRHVSWGMERAQEEGLPEQVRELITGHHGTRTLHFFLEKARRTAPEGTLVDESMFRYPGPKPQTRESAILMLADGAEAAVRSLDDPTREAVDAIVGKIADSVLADKQLDECVLTIGEFEQVREAIVEALLSLHHKRIKYPGFNQSTVVPDTDRLACSE